jgi:MFS family permease
MKRIYYGWVIVGVGVLVKMTGLGFGRFAYAMLLSNMRDSLKFNYSQMGLLSGGILLGYLFFSFIGGILTTRFGPKRVVITSLVVSSLSMFFIGRLSGFFPLLLFTFAMGGAAGGSHISMTTVPMAWFGKHRLGRALGIVTGGTGVGILVTGLLLPPLLISLGSEAWRQCWLFLALITFAVAVICFCLLRERPGQVYSEPLESGSEKRGIGLPAGHSVLTLRTLFIIYFIFGVSYNIYTTYFVAFMIGEVGLAEKMAGLIWAIFGWTSMASGLIWGFISDRAGRRKALLWNNGIISMALIIPLLFRQPFFLGLSSFLFGLTFLGTVTVVAASIGDSVFEKKASVYGFLTLVHGIGQFLGTTFGGYLKDLTGSFQVSLLSSLIGFLLCVLLITLNRRSTFALLARAGERFLS